MTIICATRCPLGIWIGSDSRMTIDGLIVPAVLSKWRKTERGLWWGVAGSARLIETARKTRVDVDMASDAYELAEALRVSALNDGWSTDDGRHGCSPNLCFDALIVAGGGVFRASGEGSVTDFGDEFVAEGSGRDFAYGAWSAGSRHTDYQDRMKAAIAAACRYDVCCGGPPFMELVPCDKP